MLLLPPHLPAQLAPQNHTNEAKQKQNAVVACVCVCGGGG